MKKSNVAPATEIVVSLMSHYADSTGNHQLQNDPRTYIYKTTHINIPDDVDLSVVQNTGGTVNLVLPYYDAVQKSAAIIDESELAGVSGGLGYAELLVSRPMWWDAEETDWTTPSSFGRDAVKSNASAFNLEG